MSNGDSHKFPQKPNRGVKPPKAQREIAKPSRTVAALRSSMAPAAISVLIPCYNQARYLAQALESVLSQKHTAFEVLISDDASTDDTATIAESFATKDARVRVQRHKTNIGMAANWNWCLAQARGEFVKYVFGDDFLTAPDALEKLEAPLLADPRIVLSACARRIVDSAGRILSTTHDFEASCRVDGPRVIVRCLLENRNLIGEPSAVLFRRKAARPFDSQYRQLIDSEQWFHLLSSGDFAYSAEPLCAFRRHDEQQTSRNRSSRAGEYEGVALFARYRGLLDDYARDGGDRHRLRIAAFNTLYQARKSRSRPEWAAAHEHVVGSYVPGMTYSAYWVRHKLVKPLNNLKRLCSRGAGSP